MLGQWLRHRSSRCASLLGKGGSNVRSVLLLLLCAVVQWCRFGANETNTASKKQSRSKRRTGWPHGQFGCVVLFGSPFTRRQTLPISNRMMIANCRAVCRSVCTEFCSNWLVCRAVLPNTPFDHRYDRMRCGWHNERYHHATTTQNIIFHANFW